MQLYLFRHEDCAAPSIRHYDSEKRTMNPPLTALGIEQARKLSQRCRDLKFDVILTSDLCRAQQTAEILNESCQSTVIPNKAFREIDMGDIHTKSWEAFPDIYARWKLHEDDIPYPNGENGNAVWQRCKREIVPLIGRYQRVAIVCHGGTIRSIICGLLNIPQQKRFCLGLPLENCSITIFQYNDEDEKFYLHVFNAHITD